MLHFHGPGPPGFFPFSQPHPHMHHHAQFGGHHLAHENESLLVDSEFAVARVCSQLLQERRIVVDIEGIKLSRTGAVCLLQVATESGVVHLFDIFRLGMRAFDSGLRAVLESPKVLKLFYDVRADCDALFHQFRVRAAPLMDVQVVYVTAFRLQSQYVPGLARVLDNSRWIPPERRQRVSMLKELGRNLFAPECGGSYAVWQERPLKPELVEYARGDVSFIMQVCDVALSRIDLSKTSAQCLIETSQLRADRAIAAETFAEGPERALRDFTFGEGDTGIRPHPHLLSTSPRKRFSPPATPPHHAATTTSSSSATSSHSPTTTTTTTSTTTSSSFVSSPSPPPHHPHHPHHHHNHHHQHAPLLLSFGLALSNTRAPPPPSPPQPQPQQPQRQPQQRVGGGKGLRITPFHEHVAAQIAADRESGLIKSEDEQKKAGVDDKDAEEDAATDATVVEGEGERSPSAQDDEEGGTFTTVRNNKLPHRGNRRRGRR